MELNETIARTKERARTLREYAKPFAEANVGEATKKYIERCLERAEHNEQLAAWLTELQERREADRWISVNERIPANTDRYLVTYSNGEVDACFYCYGFISGNEVTHWKHLPKGYESEDNK